MAWANVVGAAGAIGGALLNKKSAKDAAKTANQPFTSTTTLDPGIAKLLGIKDGGGLLGALGGSLNTGSNLPGIGNNFLNAEGAQILNNGKAGTDVLMSSQYAAPTMQAAQVRAPAQNNIDLTSTFNSLLAGGDTSALMRSLQAGNALAGSQFQQNQQSLTDNLQRSVLPSIRSGAIAAGQYGGSRQGVAEGLALSDLTKQLNNSNTQFGLGTTAASTSALANAYESGQSRALSAAQGLSAQQYGTAMQDAQLRQNGDQTNIQALLATRGQNSSNLASGIGLQQGLLGAAASYGNSDLTRLGQTAGILAPFLNAGSTTSGTGQPVASNSGAAALGGGLAGFSLGSQLGGMFGNMGGGNAGMSAPSGTYFDGYGYMPK